MKPRSLSKHLLLLMMLLNFSLPARVIQANCYILYEPPGPFDPTTAVPE